MFENLLEIGDQLQSKIQNATNRVVEDAMHGFESMSSAGKKSTDVLKRSITGGKRSSSNNEDESRDIHASPTSARKATFFNQRKAPSDGHQTSHVSVESIRSGETEVRLRSEESIRLFNSSCFTEAPSKEESCNELLDLSLTLLRITTCQDALSPKVKNGQLVLQIMVFDEDGEDEHEEEGGAQPNLDVKIQIVEDETDSVMILGGEQYSHKLSAFSEGKLHLKLLFQKGPPNGDEEVLCESSAPLSQLLERKGRSSSSVNRWVDLGTNKKGKSLGKIQLQLIPDLLSPTLHKQVSCKVLTPGPRMGITPMKSYALRKMALYSVAPVFLHVYDVSNNDSVQSWNYYIKAFGVGGIFHAGVEVHGKEFSFGGTTNRKSPATGVWGGPPKRCPKHHYRESVYLGDCGLTWPQVESILNDLKPQWLARDYDLLHKNCVFFSREFAIQLGMGNIPKWVYSLAETGQQIEPYLEPYLKKSKNGANCSTSNATAKTTASAATDAPKSDVDAKETMLDHAMAARIQKSFRRKKRMAPIVEETDDAEV